MAHNNRNAKHPTNNPSLVPNAVQGAKDRRATRDATADRVRKSFGLPSQGQMGSDAEEGPL